MTTQSSAQHVSDPATCRRGFKDPEVKTFMISNNYINGKKTKASKLAQMVLDEFPDSYKDINTATQGVYNMRNMIKDGKLKSLLKKSKGTGQAELTIANKPTIKPKHTQSIKREVPITINGMTISVPGNKVSVNGQQLEW